MSQMLQKCHKSSNNIPKVAKISQLLCSTFCRRLCIHGIMWGGLTWLIRFGRPTFGDLWPTHSLWLPGLINFTFSHKLFSFLYLFAYFLYHIFHSYIFLAILVFRKYPFYKLDHIYQNNVRDLWPTHSLWLSALINFTSSHNNFSSLYSFFIFLFSHFPFIHIFGNISH